MIPVSPVAPGESHLTIA